MSKEDKIILTSILKATNAGNIKPKPSIDKTNVLPPPKPKPKNG